MSELCRWHFCSAHFSYFLISFIKKILFFAKFGIKVTTSYSFSNNNKIAVSCCFDSKILLLSRHRDSGRPDVLDRLPNDLRNRLGRKHRDHDDDRHPPRNRRSARDDERRSDKESRTRRAGDNRSILNVDSSAPSRSLKRYSLLPWEDDKE